MLSTLKWVSAGQIKGFTLVLVYYKLKVPLKKQRKVNEHTQNTVQFPEECIVPREIAALGFLLAVVRFYFSKVRLIFYLQLYCLAAVAIRIKIRLHLLSS